MTVRSCLSYNSTEKSRKVLLDISLPELKSHGSLVVWVLGCGFWWNEAEKCHKPLLTAGSSSYSKQVAVQFLPFVPVQLDGILSHISPLQTSQ